MKALLEMFKREVCDKSKEIDPEEEMNWWEMSVGFFLAKGATPEEAKELASEARYTYHYWC